MRERPLQAALFAADEAAAAPARTPTGAAAVPAPFARPAARRFWLCLYLPELTREALAEQGSGAAAVYEPQGQGAVLVNCNGPARHRGLHPGLAVNAALALCPGLILLAREPRRELRCLQGLAASLLEFTPAVSLVPPATLLLEVSGSRRLFGGIESLTDRVGALLRQRGHVLRLAGAPTARAALWLARAGMQRLLRTPAELSRGLADLPLACLDWPSATLAALAGLGLATLGDCARLPRDGFARRFGAGYLRQLDQAYGRAPEAHEYYRPPAGFRQALELPAATADLAPLDHATALLLGQLEACLRRQQSGVRLLWLRLGHADAPATLVRLGLVETATTAAPLRELLQVKLAGLALPAPVIGLELQAMFVPAAMATGELLAAPAGSAARLAVLLERLRARLGDTAVHGLGLWPEYRPEQAWLPVAEPGQGDPHADAATVAGPRPLWMLAEPLPLPVAGGQPRFRGRLQLTSAAERIETGWWDGHDMRRDYYRAHNPQGMRLWIFRDLRTRGWYLHGLFG